VRVTAATGAAASQAAAGEKKKKQVKSTGNSAAVVRGGKGFKCPQHGCDVIEDTAEAVLQHAKAVHDIEGREVVEKKVRCLWETCGKLLACKSNNGIYSSSCFNDVRTHEALHEAGEPPRGFICPGEGCESAFKTAIEAWACGAAHDVERDPKRCLFDTCGLRFDTLQSYRRHEPQHTGAWPFKCASCGKGNPQRDRAVRCCIVGCACVCGWWTSASKSKGALDAPLAPATQVPPNPHTLSE
jgi:hypothetical protein